ncbi:MAG TPA: hypothetical protein VJX67_02270 [Blastocatellia bacterium]|nr:hypothetical protein [Blastocatellia bacterium]
MRNNSEQSNIFNDRFIRVMVTFSDTWVLQQDSADFVKDFIGQAWSKSSYLGVAQEFGGDAAGF